MVARALRDDELAEYLERSERGYGDDMIAAGIDPREARETAARDVAGLLPEGLATVGHHLLVLEDEVTGERRGALWFAERERGGRRSAYVYDIEIDEPYRGRGLGRAAMLLFEQLAADLGAEDAELAVFHGNAVALSLYESLGYRATVRLMRKALPPPATG